MRGTDWHAVGEYVGYFGRDGVTHVARVEYLHNQMFTLQLLSGARVQHVRHGHITPYLTPREEALAAAHRQQGHGTGRE